MSDGYNIFHLFFRHGITFKEVSGESEKVVKDMTAPWKETILPTILARYQLKDILMQMNLVCSTKHYHQNVCTSEVSNVQVENTAKCGEHDWMLLKPLVRKSQCLWLESLPVQDALSTFITSLADIDLKRKHGWKGSFLRNGCTSSIASSECKEERFLW